MEFKLNEDRIIFVRGGERGIISACGNGCIRFQATASPELVSQDFTLMPKKQTQKHGWKEKLRVYRLEI